MRYGKIEMLKDLLVHYFVSSSPCHPLSLGFSFSLSFLRKLAFND